MMNTIVKELNEIMAERTGADVDMANEVLEAAVWLVENHPDLLRPVKCMKLAIAGVHATTLATDAWGRPSCQQVWRDTCNGAISDEWAESFQSFITTMPGDFFGHLLLAADITEGTGGGDPDNRVNRALALEVADTLGPDWAQAWYRFIVLVTKLA